MGQGRGRPSDWTKEEREFLAHATDEAIAEKFAVQPFKIPKALQDAAYWRDKLGEGGGDMGRGNTEQFVRQDRKKQILADERRMSRAKYRHLLRENERLRREMDAILKVVEGPTTFRVPPRVGGESEAIPVICWSDWHVEERVGPEEVNGINDYSLEIADCRIKSAIQNTGRLISIVKRDSKIQEGVLALLGDFITGTIHDENAETGQLSPMEAILLAQDYLASGIEFLISQHPELSWRVICKVGNHSRITSDIRAATETGHSLEWPMYWQLKNRFRDEPRLQFTIEKSYHTYVDVLGRILRFHHGHAVRYQGGVGDLDIPVNKAIADWNTAGRADIDVFGHWHRKRDSDLFVANGSVIGYNAWAVRIKAKYQMPQQTMFLIDRDHGKGPVYPIWVERGKRANGNGG